MFGHLELARALEEAVKANPAEWSAAPQDVVTALRRPLYIEHYFRALTEQAADIVPQAPAVLAAALAQPPAGGGQAADQDTEEATAAGKTGKKSFSTSPGRWPTRTATSPPA